jgi:hypothetical protein
MKSSLWARRLVPTILGAAMLGVIIFAALTPNIGVGAAQVNSQYTSTNQVPTTLEYALIGVLVAAIIAAILGLLIFQRRKKRGQGGAGGVAAWEEPQGPQSGSGPGMNNTGGGGGSMAPAAAAAVGGAGLGTAAASYDETPSTPESGPEWAEPAAPATVGGAGGAAALDESEPDIDRLMKELDQISDDILKKTPPKKGAPPDTSAGDVDADSSA